MKLLIILLLVVLVSNRYLKIRQNSVTLEHEHGNGDGNGDGHGHGHGNRNRDGHGDGNEGNKTISNKIYIRGQNVTIAMWDRRVNETQIKIEGYNVTLTIGNVTYNISEMNNTW